MEAVKPIDGTTLKKQSRKVVKAPSGNVYEIRRVRAFLFIGLQGGVPANLTASVDADADDRQAVISANQQAAEEYERKVTAILKAGMLSPSLGDGEDQISVNDLPAQDMTFLFTEIVALSGAGQEAADDIRPTSETETSSSASTG